MKISEIIVRFATIPTQQSKTTLVITMVCEYQKIEFASSLQHSWFMPVCLTVLIF